MKHQYTIKLYNDDARCDGQIFWSLPANNPIPVGMLNKECEDCLRRTAPKPDPCWMMQPPEFVEGKCEYRIGEAPCQPNEN